MNERQKEIVTQAICDRFVQSGSITKEEATALINAVALVDPMTGSGSVSSATDH